MVEAARQRIEEGPQPKHQQLRDLLIGLVVPGQSIPSERDLMAIYGVSRSTVRKAIDGLVGDGLLQRTHGLGTFAIRQRLESRLHLASFSQDMRRRGLHPSTRLISFGLAVPPTNVALALELVTAEKAWRIVRVRLADGSPVAHEDGWYSAALLPGLDRHDISGGSLYQIMGSQYGRWVDHAEQTLWGEAADAEMARLLLAPQGTPLLVFRRISTSGNRPIEYVVSRYRGDRYQVHMELSRDDLSPADHTPEGNKL